MYAQGTNLTSYFTCPWKIISQKVLKFSVVAILCKHKGGQLTQHFLCVSKCLCFQIFGEWKPSMCMMWICFLTARWDLKKFRKSRCFGLRHTFKSKLITLKKKSFQYFCSFPHKGRTFSFVLHLRRMGWQMELQGIGQTDPWRPMAHWLCERQLDILGRSVIGHIMFLNDYFF